MRECIQQLLEERREDRESRNRLRVGREGSWELCEDGEERLLAECAFEEADVQDVELEGAAVDEERGRGAVGERVVGGGFKEVNLVGGCVWLRIWNGRIGRSREMAEGHQRLWRRRVSGAFYAVCESAMSEGSFPGGEREEEGGNKTGHPQRGDASSGSDEAMRRAKGGEAS